MPQFGDRTSDDHALAVFGKIFGNSRKVEGVLLNELCRLGGGIHCVTSHLPALDVTLKPLEEVVFKGSFAEKIRRDYLIEPNYEGEGLKEKLLAKFRSHGQYERDWVPNSVTNGEVFRAAVYAVLSSNASWSIVEKAISKLDKLLCDFDLAGIDENIVKSALNKIGGVEHDNSKWPPANVTDHICKLVSKLKTTTSYAQNSIELVRQEVATKAGLAELNLTNAEVTALCAAKLLDASHKLPGMGFIITNEFLRNLGWSGFKPDRHVKRLLKLWLPNSHWAHEQARGLAEVFLANQAKSQYRILPLAYWVSGLPRVTK